VGWEGCISGSGSGFGCDSSKELCPWPGGADKVGPQTTTLFSFSLVQRYHPRQWSSIPTFIDSRNDSIKHCRLLRATSSLWVGRFWYICSWSCLYMLRSDIDCLIGIGTLRRSKASEDRTRKKKKKTSTQRSHSTAKTNRDPLWWTLKKTGRGIWSSERDRDDSDYSAMSGLSNRACFKCQFDLSKPSPSSPPKFEVRRNSACSRDRDSPDCYWRALLLYLFSLVCSS
jgi:hypothetical protein